MINSPIRKAIGALTRVGRCFLSHHLAFRADKALYFIKPASHNRVSPNTGTGVKPLATSESRTVARRFHFSPTQNAIMGLVARGLTDKQIAIELGVSEHTVRSHLDRLFKSQGVHSRSAALMNWVASRKS